MTPEQKQTLLDFIEDTAYGVDFFNIEARKAAAAMKADLAAMCQKITAEALLADGWWRNPEWNDGWYSYSIDGAVIIDIRIIEPLRVGFFDSGDYAGFRGESMYDVRELVRLLGGAQ